MQVLFHLTGIALLLLIAILCNIYVVHRIIKPRLGKRGATIYILAHSVAIATLSIIGCVASLGGLEDSIPTLVWVMYGFMLLYIPKLCYTLVSCIDYLKRPRGHIAGHIGMAVAALSFILIVGSTFNRYRIDVNEVEVVSERLPHSFDGYRIVHISDLHLETMYSRSFIEDVVSKINELQPDMIVYSGDMVNRKATELDNYSDILSLLDAPDGIYSVLGNHDYGDFVKWPSDEAREANLASLKQRQADMGWTLLNNASTHIYRGNDSIAMIGVENWGEPPLHIEHKYPLTALKERYPEADGNYDGILLEDLKQEIAACEAPKVLIVLHTSTSHGPEYYAKYPKEFEQFTPVCTTVEMSKAKRSELINAYDNTILYTDYLLHSVIEVLREIDGVRSTMIFVSDHGESLGEGNRYMHGMPIAMAPKEQYEIPFIVWCSDTEQSIKPLKKVGHYHVFHSVLNFLSIESPIYDESLNIFE